jgi:dinuclear metal center YbgI/SA1388 family protein
MITLGEIAAFLDEFAPPRLAEDWDNVGLLVGDRSRNARRVMTCLTITPASAAEAIERETQLVVTHHPLPFHALKKLTTETTTGRILLELIAARVGVYSPHTAFDSARRGINQRLAEGLGLENIHPLVPGEPEGGAGRRGQFPQALTLLGFAERVKQFLALDRVRIVGEPGLTVRDVAVTCGAAEGFLDAARRSGCNGMLIGEARFHSCLEAEASGIGLVLPGHYASERFAVEHLADVLGRQFTDLEIWASQVERDPIRWV